MTRVLSWLLYGLGHVLSMAMTRWDWSWLYPHYNRLMKLSSKVQGEGKGPWGPKALRPPKQCDLWDHPERIVPRSWLERFELVEMFEDTSHWWRKLLKCRTCGQLYFHEFYEIVDWKDGDDPQYWTFVPVYTDGDVERLKKLDHAQLLGVFPQLRRDYPKGASAPKAFWITEPPREALGDNERAS